MLAADLVVGLLIVVGALLGARSGPACSVKVRSARSTGTARR